MYVVHVSAWVGANPTSWTITHHRLSKKNNHLHIHHPVTLLRQTTLISDDEDLCLRMTAAKDETSCISLKNKQIQRKGLIYTASNKCSSPGMTFRMLIQECVVCSYA